MKKLLLILAFGFSLYGCFLDSLIGTDGDDDVPIVHQAPTPNPPVVNK